MYRMGISRIIIEVVSIMISNIAWRSVLDKLHRIFGCYLTLPYLPDHLICYRGRGSTSYLSYVVYLSTLSTSPTLLTYSHLAKVLSSLPKPRA